ncbi:MAG: DNA methyltransferase [Cytophagales bacterium]|nr:DNA methyltransferase [Cytophagales bacterium]
MKKKKVEKGVLNVKPGTVFVRDNLEIMRGLNDECVDLIYLDPPFNKNQNFTSPIGSKAKGASFKDYWVPDDVTEGEIEYIKEKQSKIYDLLKAVEGIGVKGSYVYLFYMARRLMECHRILKSTGSIYLHCDPTMSHYLKLLLDTIFGVKNFRSDITWRRKNRTGRGSTRFANNIDHIFYYVKGEGDFYWDQPFIAYDESYIKSSYNKIDEKGRFRLTELVGAGQRYGSSGEPWKGVDPSEKGYHWAPPLKHIPKELHKKSSQEKLDYLDSIGRIHWPQRGNVPRYKLYLDELAGSPVDTLWDDIKPPAGSEYVGYRTQKPLKLMERIIKASSKEGDIVFDPFCGCATTMVAAHGLNRKWVGIDVSPAAVNLVVERLTALYGKLITKVIKRNDIPSRTDLGKVPPYNCIENREILYGQQKGKCAGCKILFHFKNLTIDHDKPVSKGGQDTLDNLQLLCSNCNSIKGDRTMAYLLKRLKELGEGQDDFTTE